MATVRERPENGGRVIARKWILRAGAWAALLATAACDGPTDGGGNGPVIPTTTKVVSAAVFESHFDSTMSDSTTLVFRVGAVEIDALKAGDVLVSDWGLGVLRRVDGVTPIGANLVVTTSSAALTDAIAKGHVEFSGALSPGLARVSYQLNGVRLASPQGAAAAFYVALEDVVLFGESTAPQVVANGRIEITPSFTLAIDIDDWELKELTFSTSLQQETSLELEVRTPLFQVEGRKELLRLSLSPVVAFVGIVPVVVTPVLTVDLGFNGAVYATVSTSVTQTTAVTAGLRFAGGTWSPIASDQHSFGFHPPMLSATASLRGFVQPRINYLLYGVVGPYVHGSLYGELTADLQRDPWAEFYAGLEFGCGVVLRVLSRTFADRECPAVIGVRQRLWASSDLPPFEAIEGTYTGSVDETSDGLRLDAVYTFNITRSAGILGGDYGISGTVGAEPVTGTGTLSGSIAPGTSPEVILTSTSSICPSFSNQYRGTYDGVQRVITLTGTVHIFRIATCELIRAYPNTVIRFTREGVARATDSDHRDGVLAGG